MTTNPNAPNRRWAWWGLAALAPVVGWLLFAPSGWVINRLVVWLWYHPWSWGLLPKDSTPEGFSVVLNVMLTIPLAALLVLALPRLRWWWVVVAGIAVGSITTELVQTLALGGRSGELLDVVANTVGGLLGSLLGVAVDHLLRRRRKS